MAANHVRQWAGRCSRCRHRCRRRRYKLAHDPEVFKVLLVFWVLIGVGIFIAGGRLIVRAVKIGKAA
jgi:hypothetical protein